MPTTTGAVAPELQLPSLPAFSHVRPTSPHPLLIGASPGTTGSMSLYAALMTLGVSTVHYTRLFNATTGTELTSYDQSPRGGPVQFIRPLFHETHPAPPVDLPGARKIDLRFLAATDALLDTPSTELFFDLLATFPHARVVLTVRDPLSWARSRRARHPTDRVPVFELLGFDVAMAQLSEEQAATAFALWLRVVAASVPADRLLILNLFQMEAEELWHQLATFLGRPVPRSPEGILLPFPHFQYGEDVELRSATVTPSGIAG